MLLSKHLNVHYEVVKTEDEVWVKYQDNITFNATKMEEKKAENYLKVPFKEALTLVSRRSVFVHKGIAFVPLRELS